MHKSTIQSITYIISGSLMQLCGAIGGGWVSNLLILIGFVLFFNGLSALKKGLDAPGQNAVGLLILAAVGGMGAALLGLIPLIGMLASILFLIVFVVEIIAYLRLKNSQSIGEKGRSGISLLVTAMALAVLASLIDLVPFIGGFVGGLLSLAALLLSLTGWMRIQEGLIDTEGEGPEQTQ